ncbi:hypothetical protein SDC9_69311 [bioreactor metagenome]|uniref:Uncharacterized protein n=1 Tax=bioreactor metagenome TaxID=1076179 RepID=A0A644Y2S9_9ZZZZ
MLVKAQQSREGGSHHEVVRFQWLLLERVEQRLKRVFRKVGTGSMSAETIGAELVSHAGKLHAVFGLYRFRQKGQRGGRFSGDDVCRRSAGNLDLAAGQLLCIGGVADAHFGINHGVAAVRRKRQRGVGLGLFIAVDAGPAFLFVAADQDANPAPERDACFLNGIQRVERGNGGAFVVQHAAADEAAFPAGQRERFAGPGGARGHDVDMRHDHEHLFAFAVVDHAAVAVQRARIRKAELFGKRQGVFQRVADAAAKGCAGLRRPAGHAGNGNQARQVFQLGIKRFVDQIVIHFAPPYKPILLSYLSYRP